MKGVLFLLRFSLEFLYLLRFVHGRIIKEQVGAIVVFNPRDGVEGNDTFLARQESRQISAEGLTISLKFGVGRVATTIVDQILSNLFFRAKR